MEGATAKTTGKSADNLANDRPYGAKASVRAVQPGVEALYFYERPIALWAKGEERVYLLFGWDAFAATTICARSFVAEKLRVPLQSATELRRMAREGLIVVDCSFLHDAEHDEVDRLLRLRDAWRGRLLDGDDTFGIAPGTTDGHENVTADASGGASHAPEGAGRDTASGTVADAPSGPDKNLGKKAPMPRPVRLSLTAFLEEWLGEAADPRSDALAYPDFNATTINGLLKLEGILDERNLPTEKGERFGIKAARWDKADGNQALYALYPRKNFDMYRDLIYRLYMESKGCW